MVDRLVNSEANKRRIEAVESTFGISGTKLAIPGRVLVGEGILTKICRKKPKPRQFFLFNDVLVYGTILLSKKKYNNQHMIPLEDVTLANIPDSEENTNGWLIKTPNKSFVVYAATPTEKTEWMAHIEKCINDLIKRTGKRQSDSHAAVWIPDSDTKICMHCNKTQFTMINRRHHCRNCGRVCCGNCSKNKFLIQSQSRKPVRVCDGCYASLCQERTSSFYDPKKSSKSEGSRTPIKSGSLIQPKEIASPPPEKPPRVELSKDVPDNTQSGSVDTSDDSDDDDDDEPPFEAVDNKHDIEIADGVGDIALDNKPTFYSTSFNIDEGSVYANVNGDQGKYGNVDKLPKVDIVSATVYANVDNNEFESPSGNSEPVSPTRAAPPPPPLKSVVDTHVNGDEDDIESALNRETATVTVHEEPAKQK